MAEEITDTLTPQELIDFVSSSAELVEKLKKEKALLSEQLSKAISERDALKVQLENAKSQVKKAGAPTSIITEEQAMIIANNLCELNLLQKQHIKSASQTLVNDPKKSIDLINGLIGKVASYINTSSRGLGVKVKQFNTKTLNEEEQIERNIIYGR